jgi:hypothetical protein
MIVEIGKGVQKGLLAPSSAQLWAGSYSDARAASKAGGNEHADRRRLARGAALAAGMATAGVSASAGERLSGAAMGSPAGPMSAGVGAGGLLSGPRRHLGLDNRLGDGEGPSTIAPSISSTKNSARW